MPGEPAASKKDKLNDTAINDYIDKLVSLLKVDVPIIEQFKIIERLLPADAIPTVNLCKLLYCTGHKKEMFLHLGVLVESFLNSLVDLYKTKRWRTPLGFIDAVNQNIQFDGFLKNKTISDKANDISRWNLINNQDASDQIKYRLQAFRFLRNYGGHSKSVNEFFQTVIDCNPACDDEIDQAFKILKQLEIAKSLLVSTPPPII